VRSRYRCRRANAPARVSEGGLEPISYVLEPFDEVSPWLDVD
jgi:hypothetical protein